jgi:hypothetical protein
VPTPSRLRDRLKIHRDSCCFQCTRDVETS